MQEMPNTEIFTRHGLLSLRLLTNVVVLSATAVGCLVMDALRCCQAQESGVASAWKTGREFQQQLRSQVGVNWGGSNTLRHATSNLARYQGVAIFLDRRVDPDQEIDFAAQNTELWTLLQQLVEHLQLVERPQTAGRMKLGLCRIGPTVYIGPPRTAHVLATAAALRQAEVQQLAGLTASRLQRARPRSWPALTMPRDLIRQLGEAYGVQIQGIEQIPHDLWPAVDLPPLSFAQQMTLVLAGFDLTFSFEAGGSQVRLVPLPETIRLQREYRPRTSSTRIVEEIHRRFPEARATVGSDSVRVEATVEEHELIGQLISGRPAPGPKPKPTPESDKRYKLTVENKPIGGVATALAKSLGREIRFDPGVVDRLNDLVSFQVEDATLDQLLRAFLDPAGLSYQIDEQTLLILPGRSD
jgi:hypothetical protein